MFEQKFDGILTLVNMPANVMHAAERQGARVKHNLSVGWAGSDAAACKTPALDLGVTRPIVNIQYQWHSG